MHTVSVKTQYKTLTHFGEITFHVQQSVFHAINDKFLIYLVVNGGATAKQNHLSTYQRNEEVLMNGRPVRFGDTVNREGGNFSFSNKLHESITGSQTVS